MDPQPPALLACSHGTSSPAGRAAVAGLVQAVAERLPDLEVRAAFVDVESPSVPEALAALEGRSVTVVPLLLSAGFHVHVDLTEAVAHAVAGEQQVTLAGALGPDPRLVDVLADRLADAGLQPEDTIVLAGAGSSDARAVADCETTATALADALARPVEAAYLSAVEPRLVDAVREERERGRRVVVATYLLAPGHFHDLAVACGADVVTPPLLRADAPAPAGLVDVVVERWSTAGQPASPPTP